MARMLANVDELCAERDRQVREQKIKYPGTNKIINGPIEQRFMLAIHQYAETALDNREYFLNRPYSIGGKNDQIP